MTRTSDVARTKSILKRGEEPGRELDDWLHAERELEGGVFPHAHAS